MSKLKIFSPATVANVNCGFDVLGFAIQGLGDELVLKKIDKPEIRISKVTGATLSLNPDQNVVGVAGKAMIRELNLDFGVEVEIHKKIRLGSGVGSSAASASGIVFGINQLLDRQLSNLELTKIAMKGEALASGNEHADNVAPCLYGGFTLITGYEPLTIVELPYPNDLYVTIIHPHIEIKTKEARELLPASVSLEQAIKQTGSLAGFVAGLYASNYDLLASTSIDHLVEPHRKQLLPHFDELKKTAIDTGGTAFGISGSGPSMFVLSQGETKALRITDELNYFLKQKGLKADSYVSPISKNGNRVI